MVSDTKYELSEQDRKMCEALVAKKNNMGDDRDLSIKTWKRGLRTQRKMLAEVEEMVEKAQRGVALRKYTLILLGADPDEVDTL